MSRPQSLALVGFPPNELSAFNALFRLAARSGPGYVMVANPDQAHIILANADDVDAVRKLRSTQPAARGAADWPVGELSGGMNVFQACRAIRRSRLVWLQG